MTTAAPSYPGTQPGRDLLRGLRSILSSQEFVLATALILIILVVGSINANYVGSRNLINIFQGNAYVAVAAIGMSMVIISGNIDISVGSLIGVLAVISGNIAAAGLPIWVAWLAPLAIGAAVNAVSGFLVAYLRIPSIVVTLGMFSILKGGLISVTGGEWISDLPQEYFLSQMRPLGIPMPIYFMVVLTIIAAFWLKYSPTGRAIYAVGGNKEAARLSGISERGIIMTVFIIHGVIVGIASVLFATQLSIIQSTVPAGLELLVISASVVGGVSILGGVGTVIGSTLAAILLSAIQSSLVFIQVSPYWIRAVQGVMILVTVLADLLRRRRQSVERG
jgi:ribose/xylose/arabinose/galactoside ABC-type transport system permease subunit